MDLLRVRKKDTNHHSFQPCNMSHSELQVQQLTGVKAFWLDFLHFYLSSCLFHIYLYGFPLMFQNKGIEKEKKSEFL